MYTLYPTHASYMWPRACALHVHAHACTGLQVQRASVLCTELQVAIIQTWSVRFHADCVYSSSVRAQCRLAISHATSGMSTARPFPYECLWHVCGIIDCSLWWHEMPLRASYRNPSCNCILLIADFKNYLDLCTNDGILNKTRVARCSGVACRPF